MSELEEPNEISDLLEETKDAVVHEDIDAFSRSEMRPIRIFVSGSVKEEITEAMSEWFHKEGNHFDYEFTDKRTGADLAIIQDASEPRRVFELVDCSYVGEDSVLFEPSILWELPVKIYMNGHMTASTIELHRKAEDSDLWDCLAENLVSYMNKGRTVKPSTAELKLQLMKKDWDKLDLSEFGYNHFTKEMRDVVYSIAKQKLSTVSVVQKAEAVTASKGWTGLRMMLLKALKQTGLKERDSLICSWFAVPPETSLSKKDLKEYLEDKDIIPKMLDPNFNVVLKRKLSVLSNSTLGEIGETWIYGLLTHKQGKQTNKPSVAHKLLPPAEAVRLL